ncbi:MAG TPA: hypothetical protein VJS64_12470, partial [Pyrinomonadaceae bacterium]|nr:hypothetical protein [Pyrinomonadaceae bacterium]
EHRTLIQALQRLPQFQNREIVVLRFCHPAFKQPQPLLVLNYFLSLGQELDMVINIDGFNEVALAYHNNKSGSDFSMPADFIMSPLVELANRDFSSGRLDLVLGTIQLKQKLTYTLDKLKACKLAICYSFRWGQAKYLFGQYQAAVLKLSSATNAMSENSLFRIGRVDHPAGDAEVIDKSVAEWANASRTMNHILADNNAQYFQFIQPNQYYASKRRFSDEEKKIAFSTNTGLTQVIAMGYPSLLARMISLRAEGVGVFSAVGIFDESSDIVYVDNCCHYNEAGLRMLSNYVSRTVVTGQRTNTRAKIGTVSRQNH